MTQKEFEKRVARLMKLGRYTLEECKQLVLDDEKVDKGEPLPWDLTKEEKANQKKALSTGTRVQKAPTKRERKANDTKKSIIDEIVEMLNANERYTNVDVLNAERQIAFTLGDKKFELTLVEKREKKS
jgi:hypothetical protein